MEIIYLRSIETEMMVKTEMIRFGEDSLLAIGTEMI
jgi:hypothetical protein